MTKGFLMFCFNYRNDYPGLLSFNCVKGFQTVAVPCGELGFPKV